MKKTISVLVENQPAVLNKITGLFSRRAFNIESLAVGATDDKSISRITIIVDSGNNVVEQVEKQLNKLVEVIKVRTIEEHHMIGRELILVKVSANTRTRQDILNVCQIMGGKIDDIISVITVMGVIVSELLYHSVDVGVAILCVEAVRAVRDHVDKIVRDA